MDYAPILASAQRAHRAGELAAWCQIWLRGEGASVGLADPLRAREDDVYVLAEVDLGDAYPITGPEPVTDGRHQNRPEVVVEGRRITL